MGSGVSCPLCESEADVRTLAEVFSMLAAAQEAALSQAQQVAREPREEPSQDWLVTDQSPQSANPDQQVADVAVAAAGRLIGWAARRGLKRVGEQGKARVFGPDPGLMRAQREQAAQEQQAVIERYPDVRVCLRDQVGFEIGRPGAVSLRGVSQPITAQQVDALVAQIRSA